MINLLCTQPPAWKFSSLKVKIKRRLKIEYKIQINSKSSQKSPLGTVYCCYTCLCSFLFFVSLVVLCRFNLYVFNLLLLFCKSKIFSLMFILCVFWRGAIQYLPSYQEKYHMETNLYVTLSWQLEVPSHPPQVTSNWNNDEGLDRE